MNHTQVEKEVVAEQVPVFAGAGHGEKEIAYSNLPEALARTGDESKYPEAVVKPAAPDDAYQDAETHAVADNLASAGERGNTAATTAHIKIKRRTLWIIVAVVLVVIAALVGGLVGGLLSTRNNPSSPSETGSPLAGSTTSPPPPNSGTTTPPIDSTQTGTFSAPAAPNSTPKGGQASNAKATSAPAAFPSLSSANLIKNPTFSNGMTGWKVQLNDANNCWSSSDNPSGTSSGETPMIARIYTDGPVPCAMNQTVAGVGSGRFLVAFQYGTYVNDTTVDDGYLSVLAGGPLGAVQLFKATTSTPIRYYGFEVAAYEVTTYENDFIISFSGWSRQSVWDVTSVELLKI